MRVNRRWVLSALALLILGMTTMLSACKKDEADEAETGDPAPVALLGDWYASQTIKDGQKCDLGMGRDMIRQNLGLAALLHMQLGEDNTVSFPGQELEGLKTTFTLKGEKLTIAASNAEDILQKATCTAGEARNAALIALLSKGSVEMQYKDGILSYKLCSPDIHSLIKDISPKAQAMQQAFSAQLGTFAIVPKPMQNMPVFYAKEKPQASEEGISGGEESHETEEVVEDTPTANQQLDKDLLNTTWNYGKCNTAKNTTKRDVNYWSKWGPSQLYIQALYKFRLNEDHSVSYLDVSIAPAKAVWSVEKGRLRIKLANEDILKDPAINQLAKKASRQAVGAIGLLSGEGILLSKDKDGDFFYKVVIDDMVNKCEALKGTLPASVDDFKYYLPDNSWKSLGTARTAMGAYATLFYQEVK